MTNTLTYGQLYDKLHQLNFTKQTVEFKGSAKWLFEHKTRENAMVVLPQRKRDEPVEPFFLRSVLALLKGHDLVNGADAYVFLTDGSDATANNH